MFIGYARVSTADQNLDLQLDALKAAGCERIFTDKSSGSRMEREGLNDALDFARKGDTLVVWKLDRLGRSMKGLVDIATRLAESEIHLVSVTDKIDTTTTAGRFFFNVMAALASMERELILERTRAGLEAARRAGRVGGRKPVMTPEKKRAAQKLLDGGTPPKDTAAAIGVSLATLYRHCPPSSRELQPS